MCTVGVSIIDGMGVMVSDAGDNHHRRWDMPTPYHRRRSSCRLFGMWQRAAYINIRIITHPLGVCFHLNLSSYCVSFQIYIWVHLTMTMMKRWYAGCRVRLSSAWQRACIIHRMHAFEVRMHRNEILRIPAFDHNCIGRWRRRPVTTRMATSFVTGT